MAEDIKISLGADADNLIAALKKSINQLEALIGAADKTEKSIKEIDDTKVNVDTSEAQGELKKLGDKAEEVSKDTATKAGLLGGVMGGAIASVGRLGVESVVNAVGALGTKIYEGALAADEFGDTMEVAFKQQGITDIDGEMEKVRTSTLNLANDLGLPVQRTRELSTTIATMGGISGKQAEELTKLSAGLEVFSGGAVKGEAVALAFSKGMADPEGAAAIERLAKKYPQLAETLRSNLDPAEKMRIANETLGESFKTVAEQQGDAGGALNKLQNTMTVAFETIGSSVYDAVGPLVNSLLPVLSDGIPKAMNFLLDIFNQAKAIIMNAFAGAGGPAVDFGAIISNVANILKTTILANLEILMSLLRVVWNLAVYAFEQISNALKPAIDRMGGFQGIVDGVKNVFKFLWSILEPVGKFIIDVLVYGVTLAVSWFTKLWDAGMAIYNFFVNLNAIGAGVGAMFNSLVGTLGAVWRAITSFNWNEIGNIMSNGFTQAKNAYNEAYNASKKTGEQQRAEVKKTENEIVKSNENIKKSNNELTKTPKAPKAKKEKTEKEKELDSELEAAKKAYDKLATELDNKYKNELTIAERNGEDVKALEQKQQAERSVRLNEFLNERFGKVKDANKLLSDEELKTVIKPSEKKGETVNDVISFYRDEISKNQKALTAEVKLKAEIQAQELKGVAKEWADTVKVFEQTAQNIIPTSLARTDAALKESTGAIATYIAFLQLQQAEIQVAMMKARQAGQDETAKGLEESLQKTTEYITSLKARFESYEKNSKELIAKNESEKNLLLQASYAIKGGIAEAFNFKQYKEEQKAAEERKAQAKEALDGEEDDIRNSFAKRETTFDAFASKIADINKKRQDAEQQDQKSMLDRLKMAGDKAAATMFSKSGELFKKMASDMKGGEKVMFESFSKLSMKFGELAATGKATLKDFAGATIDIAVNALMEMIPIWTAQIFGTSVAQLGIGGLAVAAGLQAALLALVFAARSSAGFKDGVVGLEGEGTETSDSIPAWLSKGESVITARATKMNREELEWMNKTGKSISEFYAQKQSALFVNDKGILSAYVEKNNTTLTSAIANKALNIALSNELLEEIRALRKDTKSLGTSISRNTTVDVHGEFKLERKHITALVESNRRKQSRRY